jgi:hypothetical protein
MPVLKHRAPLPAACSVHPDGALEYRSDAALAASRRYQRDDGDSAGSLRSPGVGELSIGAIQCPSNG